MDNSAFYNFGKTTLGVFIRQQDIRFIFRDEKERVTISYLTHKELFFLVEDGEVNNEAVPTSTYTNIVYKVVLDIKNRKLVLHYGDSETINLEFSEPEWFKFLKHLKIHDVEGL